MTIRARSDARSRRSSAKSRPFGLICCQLEEVLAALPDFAGANLAVGGIDSDGVEKPASARKKCIAARGRPSA